uniref:Zn_Tnp_IS91 domain-containing protein n=1 Tax=Heterorhabditis bacteriophora TaxID=37862 RepID=A0A1I7WCY8_HETBA
MAAPDQPIHPNDVFPGLVAPGFGHGFEGFHRPLDRVAVRGMDGLLLCRIGRQCKRHGDIQRCADCQVKADAMPTGQIRDHLAVFVAQRGLAGLIKADFDLSAIPGSVA